jgi:lipoprotein NlpI
MQPLVLVGLVLLVAAQDDVLKQADEALRRGQAAEAVALASKAIAVQADNSAAYLLRGTANDVLGKRTEALADLDRAIELAPRSAEAYQQRGCVHFKRGQFAASVRDFDKYIELRPERKVSHWQRGISYYYAGQYDEGRRQFEGYQDYDSNDVENAIWRFMCMARADGMAKARQALLKIGDDRRVPMRQVYDLFKGDLKPDDVLAAARAGKPAPDRLNQQLFYAHLYVGIYYDLLGDTKKALEHLNRATEDHRIGHYMWDVARVHRDLLQGSGVRSQESGVRKKSRLTSDP